MIVMGVSNPKVINMIPAVQPGPHPDRLALFHSLFSEGIKVPINTDFKSDHGEEFKYLPVVGSPVSIAPGRPGFISFSFKALPAPPTLSFDERTGGPQTPTPHLDSNSSKIGEVDFMELESTRCSEAEEQKLREEEEELMWVEAVTKSQPMDEMNENQRRDDRMQIDQEPGRFYGCAVSVLTLSNGGL